MGRTVAPRRRACQQHDDADAYAHEHQHDDGDTHGHAGAAAEEGHTMSDEYVCLTPEATGLDLDLLARLALRTQHRDADGTPVMSAEQLAEAVEMDRIERQAHE